MTLSMLVGGEFVVVHSGLSPKKAHVHRDTKAAARIAELAVMMH